ncbi:hypothetical protein VYU27_004124 [Nannochloropsis oceanica]
MFTKLFNSGSKNGNSSKPFEGDVESLWYLDGKAYDLGKFVKMHPGGADVLLELRGKNGTSAFHDAHGTSPSSAPHKKLLRMEVKGVSAEVLALKFPKSEQVAP